MAKINVELQNGDSALQTYGHVFAGVAEAREYLVNHGGGTIAIVPDEWDNEGGIWQENFDYECTSEIIIVVGGNVETSNEVEMISEQPTAIDGIFYSIDDDGYITANVDDMSENLQIRFIGTSDKRQHAMLLKSDIEAAEKYRTEMEEMYDEDDD